MSLFFFQYFFLYIYDNQKDDQLKFTSLILAFYMLIGGLIPNSDFSQLVRIPDMMEHFQLHQEELADSGLELSFWDFIKIHFISPNGHEHDGDEHHQNCPFQSFCSSTTFVFTSFTTTLPEVVSSLFSNALAYQNAFYLKGFVNTETQPPSFA